MAIRLILQHQNQKLALDLEDGVYRIGRDPKSDVPIPDSTVSGQHAELQILDGNCLLRDLGSSNGTFVNEERIHGAHEVRPGDAIRLGGVNLILELRKAKKEPKSPAAAPTARLEARREQVAEAKGRIPWTVRYWIAGAFAIFVLMFILVFVQLYSESAGSELRLLHRFKALGAQYVHLLSDPERVSVPAPLTDESLAEPIFVLNAEGRVVYPPPVPQPDGPAQPVASPLISKKTGRVPEAARYGLVRLDVSPGTAEPLVEVRSYPVRSGGDLLGFVIAKPALDAESALGNVLIMIFMAGFIALIFLWFTLKPVHAMIESQLAGMREKLSAFANGFIDALPRSSNIPELNALATEAETVLRAGAPKGAKEKAAGGESEFDPLLAELVDLARVPYCFVDGDFRVLTRSGNMSKITELSRAGIGNSIFESGMTNVQSKQLVEAIAEARTAKSGQARMTLSWQGQPQEHDVSVRAFSDPGRGSQIFGLMFRPIA